MTGFSAEWLALRERADDGARDEELLAAAVSAAAGAAGGAAPLIVDLGGGTGATLRVLGPRLPNARWRIYDNDAALLERIETTDAVATVAADLAAAPEAAFAIRPGLVTASAFFDLVSADWIERFADLLAEADAPLYAALTYDGREEWPPGSAQEAAGLAAFHQDMKRDKGFGPALGPEAAGYLETALRSRGFAVRTARSDWRLSASEDGAMIAALAKGAAQAAAPALGEPAATAWLRGRLSAKTALVGHVDLLATPE